MGESLLQLLGAAGLVGAALGRKLVGAGTACRWRRALGLGLVGCFVLLLLPLWHPVYRFTGLLQFDARNEASALAVVREEPVALLQGGYDGQYYAQLACDPGLRTPELPGAIDSLAYRARRILLPAAAWALGLGRPAWAIQIYPWLNIGCWLALAWVLWPLLQAESRWTGLAAWAGVLFSAGALASVRYALTDLPALLLFVLAMRAGEAGRPGRMACWFGLSLLTRETMFAGAAGVWWRDNDKVAGWFRGLAWIGAAAAPLAAWLCYVRWVAGETGAGQGNFQWPGVGLLNRGREAVAALGTQDDCLLAWASLLATAAVAVQLVFLAIRADWTDRWWRAGAGFAALTLVLGDAVWEGLSGAAPRVLLPLLVVCSVLAVRRRWAPLWLLALNLSVPLGLWELTLLPNERELAAARHGDTAAVLRAGEGCYGPERRGTSRWVWTGQNAVLRVRVWHGGGEMQMVLTGRLRALDNRELVITGAGGELWRGRVGPQWTSVQLAPVAAPTGWVTLTLRADSAPVREGPGADARLFSVCLLEPRIELRPREPAAGEKK
jgi:hypothetical protein